MFKKLMIILTLIASVVATPIANDQIKQALGEQNVLLVYNHVEIKDCILTPFGPDCRILKGRQGGTGFFMRISKDKQVIITNAHVCKDKEQMLIKENGQEISLKVIKKDDEKDLCALAPHRWNKWAYLLSPISPYKLQNIYTLGHPHLMSLHYAEGKYGGNRIDAGQCYGSMTTGVPIYPGNSGSAVLDSLTHTIVGVVRCSFAPTISSIVSYENLKSFISDLK